MSTIINSFNFVIVMVLASVCAVNNCLGNHIVLNRIAIITDLHVDGHISLK